MSETSESKSMTAAQRTRSALSRVFNLSIFFIGIGMYAAAGLVVHRTTQFAAIQTTYFSVGAVVGAVGLLLWIVAR